MGIDQFIALIKSKQGDMSLREYAPTLGVSAAYLHDVYHGRRSPGPTIARSLGYEQKRTVSVAFVRRTT